MSLLESLPIIRRPSRHENMGALVSYGLVGKADSSMDDTSDEESDLACSTPHVSTVNITVWNTKLVNSLTQTEHVSIGTVHELSPPC